MFDKENDIVNKNLFPVSVAAVVDRAIFHPMETVITARQDQGKSIFTIVRNMYSNGIRSFYTGYVPSIVSAVPIRVSIYSTYLLVKDFGEKNTTLSAYNIMLAGGVLSGIAEAIVLCPSESYRTRKVLNIDVKNQFHPKALYSGFLPLVCRTSLENTICLMGSDLLLEKINEDYKKSAATPYFTGLLSGAASQILGGPIDVLKTRVMKNYGQDISFIKSVNSLLIEQAFFRSVGLRALRAGICNSMMLGTTAVVQKMVSYFDEDMNHKKNDNVILKK